MEWKTPNDVLVLYFAPDLYVLATDVLHFRSDTPSQERLRTDLSILEF